MVTWVFFYIKLRRVWRARDVTNSLYIQKNLKSRFAKLSRVMHGIFFRGALRKAKISKNSSVFIVSQRQ